MPGRGLGQGVVEGTMYVQQRRDALDAQAQEMALRNAMQNLNERQFDYSQQNDMLNRGLRRDELKFEESKYATTRVDSETKRKSDVLANIEEQVQRARAEGYGGDVIAPQVEERLRLEGIDAPPGYIESIRNYPKSPRLQQQGELANARLKESRDRWLLTTDERKRNQILGRTIQLTQLGIPWEVAQEVITNGMMSEEQANMRQLPSQQGVQQQPQAQPPAPQFNMVPQQTNPVLQGLLGIGQSPQPQQGQSIGTQVSAAPGQQAAGGRGVPTIGVAPYVQKKMDYMGAQGRLMNQRAAEMVRMMPLKQRELMIRIAVEEARKANLNASTNRILKFLPYEIALKQANIDKVKMDTEIEATKQKILEEEQEWRRLKGLGPKGAEQAREKALQRNEDLNHDRRGLLRELQVAKTQLVGYRVLMNMPDPHKDDPKRQELLEQKNFAIQAEEDAANRVRQIYDQLATVENSRKSVYPYVNPGDIVIPVNNSGKPRPPAAPAPGEQGSTMQGKQPYKPVTGQGYLDQRTRPDPTTQQYNKTTQPAPTQQYVIIRGKRVPVTVK